MARIRTIKPEFFSSDDICCLSMCGRLLYIGLWCEADREGRLEWKPSHFKRRYFPDDAIDIVEVCQQLVERGLVVLYGDGLAYIPKFTKHQHINPREAASILPPCETSVRDSDVSARDSDMHLRVDDASARVSDAHMHDCDVQVGREGKGRERKREYASRATRLSQDWQPSIDEQRWAEDERPDLNIPLEVEKFRDYWSSKGGADARKVDWTATWRNWVRNGRSMVPPPMPVKPRLRRELA